MGASSPGMGWSGSKHIMDIQRTGENIGRLAAAAFESIEDAETALQALEANGFKQSQIGIVASTEDEHLLHEWMPEAQTAVGDASPTHVTLGGVLGGLLGGAVALAVPGVGLAVGAGIVAGTAAGPGDGRRSGALPGRAPEGRRHHHQRPRRASLGRRPGDPPGARRHDGALRVRRGLAMAASPNGTGFGWKSIGKGFAAGLV